MSAVARRAPWLLLLLLIAFGLSRLRFDTEVLHLLPEDVPAVHGLTLHQRHFAQGHQLLVTIEGLDSDAVATTARLVATALAAQTNLVRSIWWQPPWMERPEEMAEVLAWLWLGQPPEHIAQLARRLAPEQLDHTLAETRDDLGTSLSPAEILRLSRDPLGLTQLPGDSSLPGLDQGEGIFVSADGLFRVIEVEAADPSMNYHQASDWLGRIRPIAMNAAATVAREDQPACRIRFTGGPAFVSEIAKGMQRDMTSSGISTLLIIALLFWLAHRSWRPLASLMAMLMLTLAGTMAVGGFLYGALNVVSLGFAAVMLGLVVDYGLITYQEAVAAPHLGIAELRHELAPAIGWSAFTTAAAFASLNLAGLPGLGQLGTLVAVGLSLGAVVMLYLFLPLAVRHLARPARPTAAGANPPPEDAPVPPSQIRRHAVFVTLAFGALILGAFAWRGIPRLNASSEPLRPRRSEAYDAMQVLENRLNRTNRPALVVVEGRDTRDVASRLAAATRVLTQARARGDVAGVNLPVGFFPPPILWKTNLPVAQRLAANADNIRTHARAAGFSDDSLRLATRTFNCWLSLPPGSDEPPARLPAFTGTNATALWLVSQLASETASGLVARGMIVPRPDASMEGLSRQLADTGTFLAEFDRLGEALLVRVRQRVGWLCVVMVIVLITSLWLAFRRMQELLLGCAALGMSLALLLAVMAVIGWNWNLMSLVALPVWLGSSVDSMIHVQLGLRRHGGRLGELWRTTGKALLLCTGANLAGFGSLAFSSNAGLASLDLVCAAGVVCVFVVSMLVLPAWWRATAMPLPSAPPSQPLRQASRLYRMRPWQLGLGLARRLPASALAGLCSAGAGIYRIMAPRRFNIVVENLIPLCDGRRDLAEAAARRLFRNFAHKLADLWRYEAGADVGMLVNEGSGWEHLENAAKTGRGVLLVTPHVGNWEFGALMLARHGLRPLVLTAAEPGSGFTEMRQHARARNDVDTLVVGDDPFAFVKVIKHLNAGGVVAMLLDRPPAAHATEIELFGRPFRAALAAADLARASGCIVLPVILPRKGDIYVGQALPPVTYDPRDLGDREKRREFTARILRAFEPALRQHPDQWYHFVPVWPVTSP